MELIEQLKSDGIAKGLCQEWQKKLHPGVSTKRLASLFVRGIDFCVKNDYPTLEFMRDNFKGRCEQYGVFVDGVANNDNMPDVVLNGECKCTLSYYGYSVSRVVVRHSSSAIISVFGSAHVTIDTFDNSTIKLYVSGTKSRVLVNKYGNSKVESTGNGVKVVVKNKNIY